MCYRLRTSWALRGRSVWWRRKARDRTSGPSPASSAASTRTSRWRSRRAWRPRHLRRKRPSSSHRSVSANVSWSSSSWTASSFARSRFMNSSRWVSCDIYLQKWICVCQLEQFIMDSKFLREESLPVCGKPYHTNKRKVHNGEGI